MTYRRSFRFRPVNQMLAVLLAVMVICGHAGQARAFDYVDGLEAVPVMPGLHQSPEGSLIFDKPEGRILEARLSGDVDRERVLAYYRRTLPSLGWNVRIHQSPDRILMQRGDESLSLEWIGPSVAGGPASLIFRLNPAP